MLAMLSKALAALSAACANFTETISGSVATGFTADESEELEENKESHPAPRESQPDWRSLHPANKKARPETMSVFLLSVIFFHFRLIRFLFNTLHPFPVQ